MNPQQHKVQWKSLFQNLLSVRRSYLDGLTCFIVSFYFGLVLLLSWLDLFNQNEYYMQCIKSLHKTFKIGLNFIHKSQLKLCVSTFGSLFTEFAHVNNHKHLNQSKNKHYTRTELILTAYSICGDVRFAEIKSTCKDRLKPISAF